MESLQHLKKGQSVQTTIGSNVSISMQTLTDGKFLVPFLCIITLSSQDGAIELATDTRSKFFEYLDCSLEEF